MKLTDAELAAMPAKARRYPEEVALYRENDFLTAYALHTGKRIRETGYAAATGNGDSWEEHGNLQRDFLIKRGLKPGHKLLEIGCGTGRLARKIVPYMGNGYVGIDISHDALRVAAQLAETEGWISYVPTFVHGNIPDDGEFTDFAWAFSVFNHLPLDIVRDIMWRVADKLRDSRSQFLFSYLPEPRSFRSGLKTFKHTELDYQHAACDAGLSFSEVKDWILWTLGEHPKWADRHHVACARLK